MKLFYLIIVTLLVGCKQFSTYTTDDFKKHPEINVFLFDTLSLTAKHYYDRAWLHFSFQTKSIPEDRIMEFVDSIAVSNDWNKINISDYSRKYLKLIKSYPADNEIDTLYFDFNLTDKKLNFKWH